MGQVWLIASGKGGVGKSTLCAALGCALAEAGQSVAILDAVLGLRNQDTLLGLADRIVYDLMDVVEKNCDLEQALIAHPTYDKLKLLPASQFHSAQALTAKDMKKLVGALRVRFDHILIDCPTGVEKGLLNVLETADRTILVVTPDDISIRDAERTAQILEQHKAPAPEVIINRLVPEWVKDGIMYTPETISMTLDRPLLGIVPHDDEVYKGMLTHEDWMDGTGEARYAVARIAQRMLGSSVLMPQFIPNNRLVDYFKRKRGGSRL